MSRNNSIITRLIPNDNSVGQKLILYSKRAADNCDAFLIFG